MKSISRTRIIAAAAAMSLAVSAAACTSDEEKAEVETTTATATKTTESAADSAKDADSTTTTVTESATEADESVAEEISGVKDPAASDDKDATADTDADVDTTDVEDANGTVVALPTAIYKKYEELGGTAGHLGKLTALENEGNNYLASFNEGYHIAYSPETGAHILLGKIAETWLNEGGLNAEIGMPTAHEVERKDGNGWAQNFENGDILWTENASGTWAATIE